MIAIYDEIERYHKVRARARYYSRITFGVMIFELISLVVLVVVVVTQGNLANDIASAWSGVFIALAQTSNCTLALMYGKLTDIRWIRFLFIGLLIVFAAATVGVIASSFTYGSGRLIYGFSQLLLMLALSVLLNWAIR